jgi:hypothetical protein
MEAGAKTPQGEQWETALNPSDLNAVLEKATVQEHSVLFMQAMSGGEPFLEAGPCAVFVGTAHMPNLLPQLAGAGFRVRRSR